MTAEERLRELIKDIPAPGARTVAGSLLKEVVEDRVQYLYDAPIRDWVLLIQKEGISSIDDLKVRLGTK